MKSYATKLLMLSGIAAMATACSDLDTDIKTNYTTFPDNPIAIEGEFSGCYYYIRNEAWVGRNFWEGVLFQGDEVMGCCYTEASYYDNGRFLRGSIHDLKPDTPGTGQLGDLMSGITYTNTRILNYGGPEGKDAVVAPLRAIRAFYHFWMMELYGDAPILDHVLAEGEAVDRSPRADVARFVEQELLEIIPDLTEVNDATTYGRPNKWMAEALLVKLYLNWGVYTHDITTVTNDTPNEKLDDCVYWCDELIRSGVFEVGQGYRRKFFPDNGVHIKDFIYAVPMDPATLGAGYWGGAEFNRWSDFKKSGLCEPCTWGWTPTQSTAGNYVLTPECADRFNLEGDERNIMILTGPQYAFDENYNLTDEPIMVYRDANHRRQVGQLEYQKDFEFDDPRILSLGSEDDFANLMKGARIAKYPPRQIDDTDYGRKQANDIPVFRFADILLTKAECILRGATATLGDTPASLMNTVRDCASAPHVAGNPTLQELLDERSRELIYEMWRRNDLIRFGQFEADWGVKNEVNPAARTDLWRRLMPVPLGVMETNTNWTQNFGY